MFLFTVFSKVELITHRNLQFPECAIGLGIIGDT